MWYTCSASIFDETKNVFRQKRPYAKYLQGVSLIMELIYIHRSVYLLHLQFLVSLDQRIFRFYQSFMDSYQNESIECSAFLKS